MEERLRRVTALLDVGVEMQSALVIELIRSLFGGHLDAASIDYLFDCAEEASDGSAEIVEAREKARGGHTNAAIADLQLYLQRTLVDEVPIAERRLRRSGRFERSG